MGATILRQVAETYNEVRCASCSVVFFIPEAFETKHRQDGSTFFCINGHSQYFPGETAEAKIKRLQREAENAKASQEFAERLLTNERAARAIEQNEHTKYVKRIQKRAAAGTCPCCHRTISQMARHMKIKHPDFIK